ncbi:MAG: hypothetical protein NTX27_01690 [Verrucomicrobia bacterium]|nr:hypothetical protein [Verrucomicrobiota bacterium]
MNNVIFGPGMRRWLIIALCVLIPFSARANPYILNPSSLLAFAMVAFMALVVEAGIVALVLLFANLSPLRLFGAFWLTNCAVFVFLFCPLQQRLSLPLLEALVVTTDAVCIMALSRIPALQGDSYTKLGWMSAVLTSLVGNAASLCVGVMASGEPWKTHEAME